ncbi:MAG: 4-alpha-glucanotransferase [Aquihabitans sp.]
MATTDEDRGWGIAPGYHDVWGNWKTPSPEAATALRREMGAATDDPDEHAPSGTPLQVVPVGAAGSASVPGRAVLFLEDGTEVRVRDGRLPADLPLGYHRLEADAGRSAPQVEHVVVVPPRCHVPDGFHAWGITAQLYAARSRASWGMGDLGDLRRLADWATERGASTIGLNPLHANAPGGPPANSPYSPSSRRFLDPIYLDVAALLHGSQVPADEVAEAVQAGAALDARDRIDRDAVWTRKLAALERLWELGPVAFAPATSATPPGEKADAAELLAIAEAGRAVPIGAELWLWGTYCAVAERHGPGWTTWPEDLRRPEGAGIARFGREHADRVAFWTWLQLLTEAQLAASGAGDWLITDLAVGFANDGFDAWQWQDHLALGTRIGAPPDLLGPDGQDWGLPPFVPSKVRSLAYRPIAETLRANLCHGAGIRIDHVMGLLRLFWIPPGLDATEGAYVRWHGTELLDIVALESVRAGALVVGEDLGTVDDEIRHALGSRAILSTRLLWFEDDPTSQWPQQAMGAVTTHDLPTIAGVWSGVDLADQRAAGVTVPADGDEMFRHRLRVAAACDDGAATDDVAVAAHAALAAAPSMLVTAALDDLVGAEHRPNVPGTIDEHPNWRIPLPIPLDDLPSAPLAERIVAALSPGRSRSGSSAPEEPSPA